MKDWIIRQAYDKGYEAGQTDKAAGKPAGATANPYRPTRWETGRDGFWSYGYYDGYVGRQRRPTHEEYHYQLCSFREDVLAAFVAHRLFCSCSGLTHDADCPLGLLEVEAEAIRAEQEAQEKRAPKQEVLVKQS